MTTELLTQRAAALLEAAEAMVSLLRDHQDEIARGEAPHVFTALDAYVELQESAQALRLHFDSPAEVSAFDALVSMHGHILECDPLAIFCLSYQPGEGWMARISNEPWLTPAKVYAHAKGETMEEACENAIDQIVAWPEPIPESEVPY